jgi:hypothetical protein
LQSLGAFGLLTMLVKSPSKEAISIFLKCVKALAEASPSTKDIVFRMAVALGGGEGTHSYFVIPNAL